MNEKKSINSIFSDEDLFKRFLSIIIVIVTALTAIIAYLQGDASARDDRANRDAMKYAITAMGRKVSGDAKVNYDYNTAYQAWYEYDLLANSAENREDTAAAKRYATLRDQTVNLSPLLAAPYFNPETGEANIAKYESDTYIVEITELVENFSAAAAVKDAWDSKANTYIVHLTIMAVSLFLLGLALTISGKTPRKIFTFVGIIVAIIATIWAAVVWLKPVNDLREAGGAIKSYALGAGLASQEQWQDAIKSYDAALNTAPDYANALSGKAQAYASLGDLENSIKNYEAARNAGDTGAGTAGELAWNYYLLGEHQKAVDMNTTALQASPGELWIQFDLGLSKLAAGDLEGAQAEYKAGMDKASKQVADAKAAGEEPPSDMWWSLDDAASGLEDLYSVLDSGEGNPPLASISKPEEVKSNAETLFTQLKNLSVGLEYTGKAPEGELQANITDFVFALPVYNDSGEITDYNTGDTFEYGTQEVYTQFSYTGMKDGDEVVMKVFVDSEEDPSWRIVIPWDLGEAGDAEYPLGLGYSDSFVFTPGNYVLELYVNSQLAQRGGFTVMGE